MNHLWKWNKNSEIGWKLLAFFSRWASSMLSATKKKMTFFFTLFIGNVMKNQMKQQQEKKAKKKTKVWWLGITRPRRSWKCAWHGRLLAAIGCYLYIVWQRWLDAARDAALSMKIALFSFQRTSLSVSRQSALVKEGWEPGSALRARPKLRILMKGSLYEFFFFFLFF